MLASHAVTPASNVLLVSSAGAPGYKGKPYMSHAASFIADCIGPDVEEILCIPYARPMHRTPEQQTKRIQEGLQSLGRRIVNIDRFDDKPQAVLNAQAILVGGGNTAILNNTLHRLGLVEPIREVTAAGTPYIGSSAGSVVAGDLQTTNDFPVVDLSEDPDGRIITSGLRLFPFNVNAHHPPEPPANTLVNRFLLGVHNWIGQRLNITRHGESRPGRIFEFHGYHDQPVLALREGAMALYRGGRLVITGVNTALLYVKGAEAPIELAIGEDITFLLR